jgi:hypothetical protein
VRHRAISPSRTELRADVRVQPTGVGVIMDRRGRRGSPGGRKHGHC